MMPAILDHLWQSTLVALGAALLTLAFRKASAGVRYGLWFAASAKFLVPFAALAALGRILAPAVRIPVHAAPQAAFIETATQPFSHASLAQVPFQNAALSQAPLSPASVATPMAHGPHLNLVLILAAVWTLGCAVVLIAWMIRSASVRSAVRSATPLAWSGPMPVLASASLWEPGLVGLWRPVLLVPQSLPDHLSQPEIDAVVAHETSHLRRRDNLTAAIHMLVEALFWFHPLVWWIGARLIDERERACDEAVVRSGHSRAAYARSLVECCRLYLQSPLPCVAGASGSNLKTRVEAIMTAPLSLPLSRSKKTLLLAAGVCAVATPVAAGLLTSPAGQRAVAQAAAVAASFAPGRADDAPSGPGEGGMVTIARRLALLPPAPAIAATDTAPMPLTRDEPMRLAALTPPASAPQPPPSAPVEAAAPAPAAGPPDAAQAWSFVRSYPAATRQRHMIARWGRAICVQVGGLAPDQAAAVKTRVEAVAVAVGLGAQGAGCRPNVDIRFSTEPQRVLDDVIAHRDWALGDSTSDTRTATSVTLPIQAWYQTNGVEFAANSPASLKILASLQVPSGQASPPPVQPQQQPQEQWVPPVGMLTPGAPKLEARQFLTALVIVDLGRTGGTNLGLISDDVAMLALSQPRSLGQCNVLPSVTDLFAGACPGRGAPAGLTAVDSAYLTALYAADPVGRVFVSQQDDIVAHMVRTQFNPAQRAILSNRETVVRPQGASARPAPTAKATPPKPSAQAAEPAEVSGQALRFVQSYAAATSKRQVIARWGGPICVRVVGLAPDQAAAVRARVEEVAGAVGVGHQPAGCKRSDIEIGFTTQAQHMLDGVVAHTGWFLGDATSDTQAVKTVTRPIQAWYRTNGGDLADAGAASLKSLVVYQDPSYFTTGPGAGASNGPGQGDNLMNSGIPGAAGSGSGRLAGRQFVNVFVIVDVQRIGGKSLGLVADDVAMLALAQPRAPDRCKVLPSVTDLFADSCSGRAAPAGLTPVDAAYLTALYGGDAGDDKAAANPAPVFSPGAPSDPIFSPDNTRSGARRPGSAKASDVAERMARILASTKVASR
jgi:beta-lactamase regulating signal transducer with metallopeptidase domain